MLHPPSAGLEDVIERRRRSGLDRLDEVWDGVLHLVPAPSGAHAHVATQLAVVLGPLAERSGFVMLLGGFNIGDDEDDFRVPDAGLLSPDGAGGMWHPTAALVVEIVSRGDETWDKLPFYAGHDVDELLIVDPHDRSVTWLALHEGQYRSVERSRLIDLGADELAGRIDWPPTD